MHTDDETAKLLHSIRNMVFGIGLMVFALGLCFFAALLGGVFSGRNDLSIVIVLLLYAAPVLFLIGAIWWFGSRRISDPANDPQDPISHS